MFDGWSLEVVAPTEGCGVWSLDRILRAGRFNGIKSRPDALLALDVPLSDVAAAVSVSSVPSVAELRSNSEVPNADEARRQLDFWVPRLQSAGFSIVRWCTANEVNNTGDWNLDRWLRGGPAYVESWLRVAEEFPSVPFISPPMQPGFPEVMRPWHFESFGLFRYIGTHLYHEKRSCIWEPAHVTKWYPNKEIIIDEFNAVSGNYGASLPDRILDNLWILEQLAKRPMVRNVTFFCYPQWRGFGADLSEVSVYGDWYMDQLTGGTPSSYDRHQLFDGWYRRLGGTGYNPQLVFAQFVDQHPEIVVGPPIGPIRGSFGVEVDWPIYAQEFTTCILWVWKNEISVDNVHVARAEEQLPL